MKLLFALTSAAVLASSLSASAYTIILREATVAPLPPVVVLDEPMFDTRPDWSYRVDRSVLHPIPMPFPWPGPVCLSCPRIDLDDRVIMPRDLMR